MSHSIVSFAFLNSVLLSKIKIPKVKIPTYIYWDDTPDPPSGLSIEKGHVFRKQQERLCTPPERFFSVGDEEEVESGYMFTEEEFERLRYESELVKELRQCEVRRDGAVGR